MTHDPAKPREWTMRPLKHEFCPESAVLIGPHPIEDNLKVIEKSAYLALAKELEECRAAKDYQVRHLEQVEVEYSQLLALAEALLADNQRLKKALDLALYYVNGDATWEALKAKVDEILG